MLVEATAAKDPARFHRKGKNRPYRDTRINPCVAMGVSQSPLADNLENSCAFRGGGVSAPKAAAMSAYNYVVSAQKPTNVTHAVMGNFTAPDA